jgi:hypothetical protein
MTPRFTEDDFRAAYHQAVREPAVEALAEAIADHHIDHLGMIGTAFDTSVATVVREHGGDLSVDQLTAAIIHARELISEHGVMTWTTSAGTPTRVHGGGNDETRAHDARTAAALIDKH